MLRMLWVLCFAFLLLGPLHAQNDNDNDNEKLVDDALIRDQFQNDRPILIRSHDVEDDKHQIEVLLRLSRDRDGSPAKLRLPVLYRADVGDDFEFRIQSNFLTYQNPNLGFSDTSLGFKWNFSDQPKGGWAMVGSLELPTGSAGFADPGPEPTLILVYDRKLSPKWEVGVNLGANLSRDSDTLDYYWVTDAAGQISYAVTSKTHLTAAVLMSTPDAEFDGITQIAGAVGVLHSLSEHTQMSLTLGRSFSATGDDYQFLLGFNQRF